MATATETQALSALLFLYREVLGQPLRVAGQIPRARRAERLPTVLSAAEVGAVIRELRGTRQLIALVLYGSGLRLMECLTLRVKDLDLDRCEIVIRQGKGAKDRVTTLGTVVASGVAAPPGAGEAAARPGPRRGAWECGVTGCAGAEVSARSGELAVAVGIPGEPEISRWGHR